MLATKTVESNSLVAIDTTTRELIEHCLAGIAKGDSLAAMNLASVFMAHVDAKDIELNLAVVEALATLAKVNGCPEAADFLEARWPSMQMILRKRWERNGMVSRN